MGPSPSRALRFRQKTIELFFSPKLDKSMCDTEMEGDDRKWREMTSTDDFVCLHMQRTVPVIVRDYPLAFLDKCWEPTKTRSKIPKLYVDPLPSGMLFPQNGLICYGDIYHRYVVLRNPIYPENVKIKVHIIPIKPLPFMSGFNIVGSDEICGVFIHPMLKEYHTLWGMAVSFDPLEVWYKILNFESNPHRRVIKNPSNQNARIYIEWRYSHWIAKIIEFDTRDEGFRVIPSPAPFSLNYNFKSTTFMACYRRFKFIVAKI